MDIKLLVTMGENSVKLKLSFYHIKSRINNALGSISPFPVIESNIVIGDKPFMLSGLRKFVH